MRRMLRILKCFGLALSTLLLAATVFLWVRSLGHREGWEFNRIETHPEWDNTVWHGYRSRRDAVVRTTNGRLVLIWGTFLTQKETEPWSRYEGRQPLSADEIKAIEDSFKPGERPLHQGVERTWRCFGVGFLHWRGPKFSNRSVVEDDVVLAIPFWMLAVVFGLWPVGFVAWRLLRKNRRAPNQCPHCG